MKDMIAEIREQGATNAFVALVGVHMLAELTLKSIPDLPQWNDVRVIIEREVSRREGSGLSIREAQKL